MANVWGTSWGISWGDSWATAEAGGGNTSPDKPTITAGTPEPTSCALTSSQFADDDADGHAASQWQVALANDTAYASPAFDSGEDTFNLEAITATNLTAETDYICRVRHKDDSGDAETEWSEWSDNDTLTTAAFELGDPPSGERSRRGGRGRFRGLWCLLLVLLAGCTKITEIKEIDCETIEFFPHGTTASEADSAIYRDCEPPEWDGLVVRFG